jgi:hypothetical protein
MPYAFRRSKFIPTGRDSLVFTQIPAHWGPLLPFAKSVLESIDRENEVQVPADDKQQDQETLQYLLAKDLVYITNVRRKTGFIKVVRLTEAGHFVIGKDNFPF